MRQINGLWCPDDIKTKWLEAPLVFGLPAYQYDDIQEVIKVCGDRKGIAIDGGACIGAWTIHLMRYFTRVVAFEPIPHIFECLEKNTEIYKPDKGSEKHVDLYRLALSSTRSMLPMTKRSVGWAAWPHSKSQGEPTLFSAMAVDDLNLKELDLLKLDLEGHEYAGLCGARMTIMRCKPVVVVEEKLDNTRRATAMLQELGMRLVSVKNKHDYVYAW